MYKLFLCVRYLRKRRIAFFAVAAVCLCVAMVLIVVSVMGGFLQMVKDRSRGMLGDLVVENGALQGFPHYEEFIASLKNEPWLGERIHEATPVIITYGVIRFPSNQITKPAQIVGIRLQETYEVNDFKQGLFYEQYYPGTTTFESQQRPFYGRTPGGELALPPDLEQAWQSWWSQASPHERAEVPFEEELDLKRPGYYLPKPWEIAVTDGPEPAWMGKSYEGTILGTDLCARRTEGGGYMRYYARGEPVQLTFVPVSRSGMVLDTTGMPSKVFRYVDDCRTGVYDIDSMSVYVDFALLQRILEMNEQRVEMETPDGEIVEDVLPGRATQVQIKLEPGADVLAVREKVRAKWGEIVDKYIAQSEAPALLTDVRVLTWEEKQARFIAAVEKEKYLVTTLFGVISVVAVFLVGCIFYMIVQQKTRDIGIVKSVGATSLGVANIFLSYGAAVGVVGGALGTLLGTVFVWHINDVQDFLAWLGQKLNLGDSLVIWDPSVYTFDRIPNEVEATDAVVIYAVAIVASMVGSVIAAIRAARVWPVEALRYE